MNGRRVARWAQYSLIAVGGAVGLLTLSALLMAGRQVNTTHTLAENETRRAQAAHRAAQKGHTTVTRQQHPTNDINPVEPNGDFDDDETAISLTDFDDSALSEKFMDDSTVAVVKTTRINPSKAAPQIPPVIAQGKQFGVFAMVMLALLGASLTLAVFHHHREVKNWVGGLIAALIAGLALSWRGAIPSEYVGRSASVALFVVMAYTFIDARRRGRYTWPVRIGVAAAFVAVCCMLSWYERLI